MKLNIKMYRENCKLSQGQLGELCGWDQARMSHYETGRREPGLDELNKIADALNVTINDLIQQPNNQVNDSAPDYLDDKGLPAGKYQYVDFHKTYFEAGNGYENVEYQINPEGRAFRTDWLNKEGLTASELKIVVVSGESMMPRLHDKDHILIKTTESNIISGKVYALRYNNEMKVKRLQLRYDGSLIIDSDNPSPEFKQEIIPKKDLDQIQIIGRVIKIVSGSV